MAGHIPPRAVTAATGRVRCIGEVLHTGGTVAAAQARIIDAEDRLYAHATATCAILRPRAADEATPASH